MRMLGHKNIKNTLVIRSWWIFRMTITFQGITKTIEEACQLIEVGFEYVCEIDNIKNLQETKIVSVKSEWGCPKVRGVGFEPTNPYGTGS